MTNARRTRVLTLAALGALAATGSAQSGGLEANGYNWDMLFDPDTYAARATITNVMIDHDVTNPNALPGTVASSSNRIHYNVGVKGDFGPTTCLVSAQNPWGSGTDRDLMYAALTRQAASEQLTSFDAGLTCSYGIEAGPGTLRPILGLSAQTLEYDADIPFLISPPPALRVGTRPVSLSGTEMGWRAGLAYEIPEIALRISAIYNAAINYELSGSYDGAAASAEATTPQSIELKAQTGIAPGWLVLGSVKWVDWSVLQRLDVTSNSAEPIGTDFSYRDGWTVTGGVGHALTDDLTVLGTLTWDRGTSSVDGDGVLESGTQTDRWGVTLGGAYSLSEAVELTGGISYSTIAGGRNQREEWDRGSVVAISASLKASF